MMLDLTNDVALMLVNFKTHFTISLRFSQFPPIIQIVHYCCCFRLILLARNLYIHHCFNTIDNEDTHLGRIQLPLIGLAISSNHNVSSYEHSTIV
jgi:hypothetical protein